MFIFSTKDFGKKRKFKKDRVMFLSFFSFMMWEIGINRITVDTQRVKRGAMKEEKLVELARRIWELKEPKSLTVTTQQKVVSYTDAL